MIGSGLGASLGVAKRSTPSTKESFFGLLDSDSDDGDNRYIKQRKLNNGEAKKSIGKIIFICLFYDLFIKSTKYCSYTSNVF